MKNRERRVCAWNLEDRNAKFASTVNRKMATKSFDEVCLDVKKKRVIQEQHGKCNKCGLEEWFGERITLEVDHKDGDTSNNKRENLEGLCPNCHSLTKTWRGRNTKKQQPEVTDEQLLAILRNKPNIHQALWAVGLSARGKNYERAKKLLASMKNDNTENA